MSTGATRQLPLLNNKGLPGKGITAALVKSAISYAKKAGADVLEAYPAIPEFVYRHISTFVKAGFTISGETKYGRSIAALRFKK